MLFVDGVEVIQNRVKIILILPFLHVSNNHPLKHFILRMRKEENHGDTYVIEKDMLTFQALRVHVRNAVT
jgi:hypothetical protein